MDAIDFYIHESTEGGIQSLKYGLPQWAPSSSIGPHEIIKEEFEKNGNLKFIKILELSVSTSGSGIDFVFQDQTRAVPLNKMLVIKDIVADFTITPFLYLFPYNVIDMRVLSGAGLMTYSVLYQKIHFKRTK